MVTDDVAGGSTGAGQTRRRVIGATGIALVTPWPVAAGDGTTPDRPSRRPDVVAFCGQRAVCTVPGSTIVVADQDADDRRQVRADGGVHVVERGVIVAVTLAGQRVENPVVDADVADGPPDG